jgi:hypothetical protein
MYNDKYKVPIWRFDAAVKNPKETATAPHPTLEGLKLVTIEVSVKRTRHCSSTFRV